MIELQEHRYMTGRGWVGGIQIGPFGFRFEWVPGDVDPFCVWLELRYGDSRRADIPLWARWKARIK